LTAQIFAIESGHMPSDVYVDGLDKERVIVIIEYMFKYNKRNDL